MTAGKGNVWCGGGGSAGLPPLSLIFEGIFSVQFELGSSLVNCVISDIYALVIFQVRSCLFEHRGEEDAEESRCQDATLLYTIGDGEGF